MISLAASWVGPAKQPIDLTISRKVDQVRFNERGTEASWHASEAMDLCIRIRALLHTANPKTQRTDLMPFTSNITPFWSY